MNKKLGVLSILLFSFACAAHADQLVINFDREGSNFFTTSSPEVDYFNSYTGENSSGVSTTDYSKTGYRNVSEATSNEWVAYNPYAHSPSSFASYSGELFNLDSFWLAGAWGSQTLTITGYVNDIEISSTTIDVSITAQEYFFTGFQGINSFTIAIGNNFVYDPLFPGYGARGGEHWALGSVTVTAVPEPETWAMLLVGLSIVGAVTRRRRVKAAM